MDIELPDHQSQWMPVIPARKIALLLVSAIIVLVLCIGVVQAKASSLPLSPNLQVMLLSKILLYEKNFKNIDGVSVYVVNSQLIHEAFSKLMVTDEDHIGIKSVDFGDVLPTKRYDLIYLNEAALVSEAVDYANRYRAVLVTGRRTLVEKGVTLGTSAEDGRPKFYLNLSSSFTADLDWDPKVLSIVGTYR